MYSRRRLIPSSLSVNEREMRASATKFIFPIVELQVLQSPQTSWSRQTPSLSFFKPFPSRSPRVIRHLRHQQDPDRKQKVATFVPPVLRQEEGR